MNRSVTHQPILATTFLLLAAAALRLVGLNNISPPGITHDEVANWLIDRAILAGEHAIYFSRAYGHEAGFHYVQAGFVALIGDNVLALRLPAAFAGLLGVAVTFALTRKLFGKKVALMAAGLLALLFWPVFYGRLALRAISLPLVAGLSAYFWWQAWELAGEQGGRGAGENPALS
ncbi:MAG: glycosyltransferase family 39 protein, partial [Chloroflexi bacterium]|nr:glycosyltransferase family 39 protein [Chloroflexota bacterium]